MRFLRHSLTGLFLLSLTVGLLFYAGHIVFSAVQERIAKEPTSAPVRERIFAVTTTIAQVGTETPVLTAYGQIESRRTLEIRTKTSGTILELAGVFDEGGQVRAGQMLARIDPSDAQFALDRARSDMIDAEAEQREADRGLTLAQDELAAARAQAELRQRALTRQLDLQDRGVGTSAAVELAELDAAQAEQSVLTRRQAEAVAEARVDQAITRLSRARIALAEAQKALDDTKVSAPFSGTLKDVNVVEGRLVTANEKLADLIDAKALDVAFRLSTSQFTRLLDAEGSILDAPVRVSFGSLETTRETTGRIVRSSGSVDEGQTGRLVYARLDAANGMQPGDFVTVHVDEPALQDVVRLPSTALGPDNTVLVLSEDSRLRQVQVVLERRQGNDVLVRGENLDQLEIVSARTPLLGPGLKVRVVGKETSDTASVDMVELSEERRARLRAFVEASTTMPDAMKQRVLAELGEPLVPAQTVERLERRMGG